MDGENSFVAQPNPGELSQDPELAFLIGQINDLSAEKKDAVIRKHKRATELVGNIQTYEYIFSDCNLYGPINIVFNLDDSNNVILQIGAISDNEEGLSNFTKMLLNVLNEFNGLIIELGSIRFDHVYYEEVYAIGKNIFATTINISFADEGSKTIITHSHPTTTEALPLIIDQD